ncbi:MAG: beta-galactosidase [Clostridia bacterium]|nr:beta-galactosidase [Clostridia bacterium]
MDKLLFGAAYYDEYMPHERLAKDVEMMKRAGMNVVRIAESTWSTCEPQEGVFDFSHVERVMDAMEAAGISVIIGTPTYAIPTWMVKSHPDVLAETKNGRGKYGPRQIMDISHPVYRYYAERMIRELMKRTAHRTCVIGFQIDNETKHYGTAGRNVQEKFVKALRAQFHDDLDAMNAAFGLDYWSNRINAWEDFPDVLGTINGSLGAAFEKFQRTLVTDFLHWQAAIVREYKREDQFITHNLDYEWRGHSYGVQPDIDHFQAAKCLTIPGVDVYHPGQDELTGAEIAFGGDMSRSFAGGNYLLLETQAQGFPDWTPYPGQLRLQAYSHIASGANSVMYWHWHSLHNACETYWKGVLSHDFAENAVYREASVIGKEFARIGNHLVNLKKKNDVAILVSNESLTALKWFGIRATSKGNGDLFYNDVLRWLYDALYRMNVECDVLWPQSGDFERYRAIVVPALYSAPDSLLERLRQYCENGGTLITTFKTGFTDEHVKVSDQVQPRILRECIGARYHQFALPREVGLSGEATEGMARARAEGFMELLIPEGAKVLARYDHPAWKEYAAITKNRCGSGMALHLGCMTGGELLEKILKETLLESGVCVPDAHFPLIVRSGVNDLGRRVAFLLNYSWDTARAVCPEGGRELLEDISVRAGEAITIAPWGAAIIEAE